jgi:hypothetical protein
VAGDGVVEESGIYPLEETMDVIELLVADHNRARRQAGGDGGAVGVPVSLVGGVEACFVMIRGS